MRGLRARLGESGQMSVELAVLMPVVIVVALTVYNLARFTTVCAAFDRVSLEAVTSVGVSPSGTQSDVTAVSEVREALQLSLGQTRNCTVEVEAERVGGAGQATTLSLAAHLTRFRCTLVYKPWPSSFVLAGVPFEAPLALRHERELVVDRYKTGVVR